MKIFKFDGLAFESSLVTSKTKNAGYLENRYILSKTNRNLVTLKRFVDSHKIYKNLQI